MKMQIKCSVDLNECVRRGHDFPATGWVDLEVDLGALSFEERAALADNLKARCLCGIALPEPTMAGFAEALEALQARKEQAAATKEQCALDYRAEWEAALTAKRTSSVSCCVYVRGASEGFAETSTNPYAGSAFWNRLEPLVPGWRCDEFKQIWQGYQADTRFTSWLAELEQLNDRGRASGLAKAIANAKENEARELAARMAEKKEAQLAASRFEYFRLEIVQYGTELQKKRLERGLCDVEREAAVSLASRLFKNPDGLRVADASGWGRTYERRHSLTDEQMALVLRYEEAQALLSVTSEFYDVGPDWEMGEEDDHVEMVLIMDLPYEIQLRQAYWMP